MNSDIELNINTDVDHFESWLELYRLKNLPFNTAPVEGKWISVLSAPIIHQGSNQGIIIHEFRACVAYVEYLDSIQADTEIHSGYFPVIKFVIFQTANDRINVKISCLKSQLLPYFNNLLVEVAKLWPETESKIQAHISQLTPEKIPDNNEEYVIDKRRNTTSKVIELAEFIKQEKDKKPDLSYMALAIRAHDKFDYLKNKDYEKIAENLRYAVRTVLEPSGWRWEPANRVR